MLNIFGVLYDFKHQFAGSIRMAGGRRRSKRKRPQSLSHASYSCSHGSRTQNCWYVDNFIILFEVHNQFRAEFYIPHSFSSIFHIFQMVSSFRKFESSSAVRIFELIIYSNCKNIFTSAQLFSQHAISSQESRRVFSFQTFLPFSFMFQCRFSFQVTLLERLNRIFHLRF